jgi:Arf-GAP/GTPase/ANK repeat/PH domain-containing protein 1/3
MQRSNSFGAGSSKKKFLVLFIGGNLRYYNSKSDFQDMSSNFKEMNVIYTTIKINNLPVDLNHLPGIQGGMLTEFSSEGSQMPVFEIFNMNGQVWKIQADNIYERNEWVKHLQVQIKTHLEKNVNRKSLAKTNSVNLSGLDHKEFIRKIQEVPENTFCADCSRSNPTWASVNLGVLICIKCSGIHRNLGTHISKVRSLELDDWPAVYQEILLKIGNKRANDLWLATSDEKNSMLFNSKNEHEIELHIHEKYVNRSFLEPLNMRFMKDLPFSLHRSIEMDQDSEADAFKQFLSIYLHYPYDQLVNPLGSSGAVKKTALHLAAENGMLPHTQLLLWAKPEAVFSRDEHGQTPLNSILNNPELYSTQNHNICRKLLEKTEQTEK